MIARGAVALALLALASGCAEAVPPAITPAPQASQSAAVIAPAALTQQLRRLGFLPLSLLLPDAGTWATVRDEPLRYEAGHAPSASRLSAEILDGSFGTAAQCMKSARVDERSLRIDEGVVRAPLALEVSFEAFVEEQPGEVVVGRMVAALAVSGRCHRVRFETRARGRDAAAEIGARLAFFRDVSLPSVLVVREGHAAPPARTNLERR